MVAFDIDCKRHLLCVDEFRGNFEPSVSNRYLYRMLAETQRDTIRSGLLLPVMLYHEVHNGGLSAGQPMANTTLAIFR